MECRGQVARFLSLVIHVTIVLMERTVSMDSLDIGIFFLYLVIDVRAVIRACSTIVTGSNI
jgi:hypothetical protein